MRLLTPLIEQRAAPGIYRHSDGYYYFTASVPAYDRVELRRARTIKELPQAIPIAAWLKPESGLYSELISAPEIHFRQGAWYIYFAAVSGRESKNKLSQHLMYVMCCKNANLMDRQNWHKLKEPVL